MMNSRVDQPPFEDLVSSRRNYMLSSHRRDGLIEWMKEMLHHSFALDAKESYFGTMTFFEQLIEEHRTKPEKSRLLQLVPTVGIFHTSLPMLRAFRIYDTKYSITQRRHIAPTFNEIRHILNLAQIIAIGESLKLITFDGDQTLYNDGGNFDAANDELALAIIRLLCHGVKVAVVTAAGYGWVGEKYEMRLKGLLTRFIEEKMTKENVENFFVFGGESNYLFQCTLVEEDSAPSTLNRSNSGHSTPPVPPTEASDAAGSTSTSSSIEATATASESTSKTLRARLLPVPIAAWQSEDLQGPKPYFWPETEV